MSWDAVIFDCDGTFVDSERIGNEVLVEHAKRFGVALTVEEAIARFRGVRMAECVSQLEVLRGSSLPSTFVTEFREWMREAFISRLRPMDGAAELLGSLVVPCCVASSGPREKTEFSLSVTGLLAHFEGKVFSSYEVNHWKPDPGLFLHAASVMGVVPERCAVIEDSLPGVRAGVAAGMAVFAIVADKLENDMPQEVRVVAHLREVHEIFRTAGIAL
ncbi:MAG: HAD-IA family hydrolase [Betaproteobacteria bacterium]|nr:HAD-IA family hydrolase [Betaproteobacteria bacterium]